jgi:hypothetical protein
LIANRKTRQVLLLAESTGLSQNATVEFVLIDQNSGHGYEALFWSFAKPSDIRTALMFIGIQPGSPFNPDNLRFWPKGERITIKVADTNGVAFTPSERIESLALDKKTGKTIPGTGFVFTGSMQSPDPRGESGLVCAADVYEPNSIVSLYNEPGTLLDVPRQASKGDVYGTQVVSHNQQFTRGQLLTLILEPERRTGESCVQDLMLEVGLNPTTLKQVATESGPGISGRAFSFRLTDQKGTLLNRIPTLEDALSVISGMLKNGLDPYLALRFDGAIALHDVRRLCLLFNVLETRSGIRIEPPGPGQLFYRAFLPDERWRDAGTRLEQPWELHLTGNGGRISGKLVWHEEIWTAGKTDPTLKEASFDVPTPQALRAQLDADETKGNHEGRRPNIPILIVYAGPDMTYGELLLFLQPAHSTHKTIHVFLPDTR